jgi:quercetin dioxygenase-like cupin family protein
MSDARVTPWDGPEPPEESAIRQRLAAEGLRPYEWGNAPGDTYAAHSHGYNKVIYVMRGEITFGLPATGERLRLRTGDRLDLPAGIAHDAVVGGAGVRCLEAHR